MDPLQKQKILNNWAYDCCCTYDHNYSDKYVQTNHKTIGNYVVYGSLPSRPWIMVVGGSTTSAIQGAKWSEYLYNFFKDEGTECCIFNGGCGGYNSWNELNKLARDIPTFRPDIVISYSGINDYYLQIHPDNPLMNQTGLKEISSLDLFKSVNIPKTSLDHADVFLARSVQMNAIANSFGSKFFRVLQPALGYGNYKYDASDPLDNSFMQVVNDNTLERVKRLKPFYDKIIDKISSEPDTYSFLKNEALLFDGKSRLFADFRHPNPNGYKIIAQRIHELIKDLPC